MGLDVTANLSYGVLLPTEDLDVLAVAEVLGFDVDDLGADDLEWGDLLQAFEDDAGLTVVCCGSGRAIGHVLAAKTIVLHGDTAWRAEVKPTDLGVAPDATRKLRDALARLGIDGEPAWLLTVMRWT